MNTIYGSLPIHANTGEVGIKTSESYGVSKLTEEQKEFNRIKIDAHMKVLRYEAVNGKRENQVKYCFDLKSMNRAIEANSWTQRKLGKACGCSDATISLTKRGNPVGEDIARRICESLGLDFDKVTFEVLEK